MPSAKGPTWLRRYSCPAIGVNRLTDWGMLCPRPRDRFRRATAAGSSHTSRSNSWCALANRERLWITSMLSGPVAGQAYSGVRLRKRIAGVSLDAAPWSRPIKMVPSGDRLRWGGRQTVWRHSRNTIARRSREHRHAGASGSFGRHAHRRVDCRDRFLHVKLLFADGCDIVGLMTCRFRYRPSLAQFRSHPSPIDTSKMAIGRTARAQMVHCSGLNDPSAARKRLIRGWKSGGAPARCTIPPSGWSSESV